MVSVVRTERRAKFARERGGSGTCHKGGQIASQKDPRRRPESTACGGNRRAPACSRAPSATGPDGGPALSPALSSHLVQGRGAAATVVRRNSAPECGAAGYQGAHDAFFGVA